MLAGAPQSGGKRTVHGPPISTGSGTGGTCTGVVLPLAARNSYTPGWNACNSSCPGLVTVTRYVGRLAAPPAASTSSSVAFSSALRVTT
jgi:hypothetical protein